MASSRIKTKSVYDPVEDSDGIRILVTRYHPRIKGFKKGIGYSRWLRNLSPAESLVKKLKTGKMTNQEFSTQYILQLAITKTQGEIGDVRELLRNGETVTLLCYEPEGEFCHRHLLKGYLQQAN
jgi:uncharacterized protein YeaO (DUF488 family)